METFSLLSDNSQFSSASAVYNTGTPCRCVVSVLAEPDAHRFLVGTANVRGSNHVHVIEFDDTDNVVSPKVVLDVTGEVWSLFPCPSRKELCFAITTDEETYQRQCILLSIDRAPAPPGGSADGDVAEGHAACPPLLRVPDVDAFSSSDSGVLCVVWRPMTDDDALVAMDRDSGGTDGEHTFVTVYANGFQVWDLMVATEEGEGGATQLQPREEKRCKVWEPGTRGLGEVTAAAWDPHHKNELLLAVGMDLVTFNLDTMEEVRVRERGVGG
jgi:hypothetical protein